MTSVRLIGVALFLAVGLTASSSTRASAQESRAALIEQARGEFDESRGMTLLLSAVGLTSGDVDSLWTVAVHEIAATLLRSDDRDLATLWLRLSARHGSAWPIDAAWFEPQVVDLYAQVSPQVRASTTREANLSDRATTRWQFPVALDANAEGELRVSATGLSDELQLTVTGVDTDPGGGTLSLRPGTYEVVATSSGFDTVRATREVLAGATTLLDIELNPVLAEGAEERILGSLVRIARTPESTT